jgi:hypothetical protein
MFVGAVHPVRKGATGMDIGQVLKLYDLEERRDAEEPGMRREITPDVVRHIDLVSNRSMITHSHLDLAHVDEAIRKQVTFFDQVGHDVEWKVYAYDPPADLHDRLVANGFEAEEAEAIMVLDLYEAPPSLMESQAFPGSVRRILDPEELDAVIGIEEDVWQEDYS